MQFITEEADYKTVLTEISATVDFSKRIPAQVFREAPRRFVITEFGLLWNERAWEALTTLAGYYLDPDILLVGNPPDARLWIPEFGHWSAAVMSVREPGLAYRSLTYGETSHPFRPVADTIALVGRSRSFAVWGEREAEVAVFGLYDRPDRPASRAPFLLRQLTMDETLAIIGATFINGLPEGFVEQMRGEYGKPGQGPY